MTAQEERVCLCVQADIATELLELVLQRRDSFCVLTTCLIGVLFALALTGAVFGLFT